MSARVRGGGRARLALLVVVCALVAVPAGAQYPVCPRLGEDTVAFTGCPEGGRFRVARFLTSFGIEHVFDSSPTPFTRAPGDFLRVLAPARVADDAAVRRFLADLEPVDFTKLDTSTGTFRLDVAETRRSFRWEDEHDGARYRVSARLPQRIEGGYWRAPDVLEMAFWEANRLRVKLTRDGKVELSDAIACLSITADALRLVTTDGRRDVLIAFAPCP